MQSRRAHGVREVLLMSEIMKSVRYVNSTRHFTSHTVCWGPSLVRAGYPSIRAADEDEVALVCWQGLEEPPNPARLPLQRQWQSSA